MKELIIGMHRHEYLYPKGEISFALKVFHQKICFKVTYPNAFKLIIAFDFFNLMITAVRNFVSCSATALPCHIFLPSPVDTAIHTFTVIHFNKAQFTSVNSQGIPTMLVNNLQKRQGNSFMRADL